MSSSTSLPSKSEIKKLLYLQYLHNGIPKKIYFTLSTKEKKLLYKSGNKFFLKPEYRKKITVVLTGGVFDILHYGHLFTLSQAKKEGDFLVVVVANDETVKKKKREPIHSAEYRKTMVEALKPVDIALIGKDNPLNILDIVKPDVIVYGYDQEVFINPPGVRIVKLNDYVEPDNLKTNKIIKKLGL